MLSMPGYIHMVFFKMYRTLVMPSTHHTTLSKAYVIYLSLYIYHICIHKHNENKQDVSECGPTTNAIYIYIYIHIYIYGNGPLRYVGENALCV